MHSENPIVRTLLFVVTAISAACGGPSSDGPAAAGDPPSEAAAVEASATDWAPTTAQMERAAELGRDAAGRLAGTLIQQLTARMEEGGPESAIEFCSAEAMSLTHAVNEDLGDLDVKRTSTRVRNPENAPDALERAALSHFRRQMDAGALPDHWVQTAGDEELRYYQPLVVNEMCAQCHGPADQLRPAVRERLEALYPQDEAVGYAPGDFRGLIRVAIPREVLEEG